MQGKRGKNVEGKMRKPEEKSDLGTSTKGKNGRRKEKETGRQVEEKTKKNSFQEYSNEGTMKTATNLTGDHRRIPKKKEEEPGRRGTSNKGCKEDGYRSSRKRAIEIGSRR